MTRAALAPLTSKTVERLLQLPRDQRMRLLRKMPRRKVQQLLYEWRFWARPEQVWRPGPHMFTVYLAGRGWGKTRTGAEAAIYVARHPELCGGRNGKGGRFGIAGRTANDVNGTMVWGVSGIMACSPPDFRPVHNKSERTLTWPNGCVAQLFSGEEPDSFRGPNIGWLWADELAHWKHLAEAWTKALGMLRYGSEPRAVITTTPLGVQTVLEIVFEMQDGNPVPAPPGTDPDRVLQGFLVRSATKVIGGSTYDNAANLARKWMTEFVAKTALTVAGPQEIHGKILLGSPNAIWQWGWIRRIELVEADEVEADDLEHGRIVSVGGDILDVVALGMDPAITSAEDSAEFGLVVVGLGRSGRLYLLGDHSGHYSPEGWASAVEIAIKRYGVTHLAYEDNAGGDLIESNLRTNADRTIIARARKLRCRATRSKGMRAAIVAPLWEAGKVEHVGSPRNLAALEAQMRNFDPSKPERGQPSDRMDALVWAMLALVNKGSDRERVKALADADAWARVLAEIHRRMSGHATPRRPARPPRRRQPPHRRWPLDEPAHRARRDPRPSHAHDVEPAQPARPIHGRWAAAVRWAGASPCVA